MFERAVQKQMVNYLHKHNIICNEQSGFREQHSTVTAVTDVTDFILRNMDKGLLTGAVYLDLKKAFDTVDVETMLFKLNCLGVKETELLWFRNYLSDRVQCVQYMSAISGPRPVSCGVPQGSILGPVLFVLFVNDLPQVIKHAKITLYADDTVLLYPSANTEEIKACLEVDLQRASVWFKNNKLQLNTSKCKWTLFGTNKRLQRHGHPTITINNEVIEHVKHYKYLGVILDSTLNWNEHVNTICIKIRQRLGLLKRIRHYMSQEVATLLHNALVIPVFDYCDVVFGNCGETLLSKLQRLQNFGGKILLQVPYDTPSQEVRSKLNWLTVKERIFYHENILMYKCQNSLCPSYLSEHFNYINHRYPTKQMTRKNIIVPRCKLLCGQRSFNFRGSILWNSIPTDIRDSRSLNVFKSNILRHIFTTRDEI